MIRRLSAVQRTLSGPNSFSCAMRSGLAGLVARRRRRSASSSSRRRRTRGRRARSRCRCSPRARCRAASGTSVSPGVHCITTPVLRCANASSNVLSGKNQHGGDERAVGECGDAVERHLVRRRARSRSTWPWARRRWRRARRLRPTRGRRGSWRRRCSGRLAAGRRLRPCSTACFGSSGPGQLAYFVRSARAFAAPDGVEVPHRLRLCVHEVQAAAGRHAARHHPSRVRDEHEVFGDSGRRR